MEVTKVINATRDFKIGEMETHALRGVNLSIEDGEFTALVGPSGSGKTTLLQLIGLLDQPTSGQVFINGKDATRLNRNQRAGLRKRRNASSFEWWNKTGGTQSPRQRNAGGSRTLRPGPSPPGSVERWATATCGRSTRFIHSPNRC